MLIDCHDAASHLDLRLVRLMLRHLTPVSEGVLPLVGQSDLLVVDYTRVPIP